MRKHVKNDHVSYEMMQKMSEEPSVFKSSERSVLGGSYINSDMDSKIADKFKPCFYLSN